MAWYHPRLHKGGALLSHASLEIPSGTFSEVYLLGDFRVSLQVKRAPGIYGQTSQPGTAFLLRVMDGYSRKCWLLFCGYDVCVLSQ